MSTEIVFDKTKRLEMYDILQKVEKLNNEVRKLRSRSIDVESDIDSQLNAEMAKNQEIHNQKILPLIKSFDLSYDHPLVVQDIWPENIWPEKPLEARHDFMMSDSEEETNYVCIQIGINERNLKSRFRFSRELSKILIFSPLKFQSVIHLQLPRRNQARIMKMLPSHCSKEFMLNPMAF